MQALIGAHPKVCTSVELSVFHEYVPTWIEVWKKESANIQHGRWHKGLPFVWSEHEFYDFLMGFMEKAYEPVIATNPLATHVLDKNPNYSRHIDTINRFLPRAKFVHIIRDGRDAAVSLVAAQREIGFGADTIMAAAELWKLFVGGAQQGRKFGDRYMEVRYEDLLSDGVDILQSVFDFCGLPMGRQDITNIYNEHKFEKMKASRITPAKKVQAPEGAYRKGKAGTWRREVSPMQRYLFDKIAGDLLTELGYAQGGWWAKSGSERIKLPLLAAISKRKQVLKYACSGLLGPRLTSSIRSAWSKLGGKTSRSDI